MYLFVFSYRTDTLSLMINPLRYFLFRVSVFNILKFNTSLFEAFFNPFRYNSFGVFKMLKFYPIHHYVWYPLSGFNTYVNSFNFLLTV